MARQGVHLKTFLETMRLTIDQKPNHLYNSFQMINDHNVLCNISFHYVIIFTAIHVPMIFFITQFLFYIVSDDKIFYLI